MYAKGSRRVVYGCSLTARTGKFLLKAGLTLGTACDTPTGAPDTQRRLKRGAKRRRPCVRRRAFMVEDVLWIFVGRYMGVDRSCVDVSPVLEDLLTRFLDVTSSQKDGTEDCESREQFVGRSIDRSIELCSLIHSRYIFSHQRTRSRGYGRPTRTARGPTHGCG